MDSFYAGLPGTPFILKQRFTSVGAMETAFSMQEEYTDVFYGEYCIIDTVNKSHPDNGKIFRRGYSDPEYIGQVVGPSGLFCDNIRIITRNSDKKVCYDSDIDKPITVCAPGSGNWGDDSPGSEERALSFKEYEFDETLEKEKYKQEYKIIVYDIYENVSDKDGKPSRETIATCFAGVYDVLESTQEYPNGRTVIRYSSSPDEILSQTLVDSDDNSVIDGDDNKILVPIIKSWLENVSFDSDTGQLVFTGNGCNETLNKVFFLKLLKNVKLDPDGTVHFLYTNEGGQGKADSPVEVDESLNQALTWIKDAHFNKNTGQLQIHFNNDSISPVVIENLAAFDSYYDYKYNTVENPSYYFEEILSEASGFYVKMKKTEREGLAATDSGYTIDPTVAAEDILSNSIFYPALAAITEVKSDEYSYKPCYTKTPLEIEITGPTAVNKKFYLNSEDNPLAKTDGVDENGEPVYVKSGILTEDKNKIGSLVWSELEEKVLYYGDANNIIAQTESRNVSEKSKAQVSFNGSPLYEIDWPLAEDGSFIEIVRNGITYRKISFEKVVEETNSDKTGSLTFGEDDGSFSYKFIGQEGVNGQFNFVKEVEENDLGYTAITNTKNETSLSKTQNFRTPKKFFFFDKNDPNKYSFHLFANYSYPELALLSEKKDENPAEEGVYYISPNLEEIYEGIKDDYQKVENSDKIFYYQEKYYQIGENGAVEESSIEKGYPFDGKEESFWESCGVEKGYWKDLGKISDGLTNDLPSLLANIAYTVKTPGITNEDAKEKILWG